MKIAYQLGGIIGAIILLLVLVGSIGVYQLNRVNTGYMTSVADASRVENLANQIDVEILQVRRSEKDFLARKKLAYSDKVKTHLAAANQIVQQINAISSAEIQQKLSGVTPALATYQSGFTNIVKVHQERGLTNESGLLGQFSSTGRALKNIMQENDTEAVKSAMLAMENREVEYFAHLNSPSKRTQSLADFEQARSRFNVAVNKSQLGDAFKQDLIAMGMTYSAELGRYDNALRNGKQPTQDALMAAADALTDAITNHNIRNGQVLYLSLREAEKDYLLSLDEAAIEPVQEILEQLILQVEISGISTEKQERALGLLETYGQVFETLTAKDVEVRQKLAEIKTSADSIIALAGEIGSLAKTQAHTIREEISGSAHTAVWMMAIVSLICAIFGIISAVMFTRRITRPLGETVDMIEEIERGHLAKRLNMSRQDEIGQMGRAMDRFADSLQTEVVDNLQKIAVGDLCFTVETRDDEDMIRGALQKVSNDLNLLMAQVQTSGEHIDNGSSQVADAAQALSQGATTSAASLEEISASMTSMSEQTRISAENAGEASTLANAAREAAHNGATHMSQMTEAMNEIDAASTDISKIIKTIDEIAFQTNLLALNAAVEAARAGQHGKGFAVVAEEVRNLASRSAKAAGETAQLIEGTVGKTRNGSEIAKRTEAALQEITEQITRTSALVSEIASATSEQAEGIGQVTQGLDQIDQVTQQNTAYAEQSAASADQLASQSTQLRNLLSRFQLRQQAGDTPFAQSWEAETTATLGLAEPMGWGEPAALTTPTPGDSNDLIVFDDSVRLGIPVIDGQHERLVGMVNEVFQAMKKGDSQGTISEILQRILDYTRTHFATEEKLLAEAGYAGLDDHKALHHQLLKDAKEYAQMFENGGNVKARDIFYFLKAWLVEHIQGQDRHYVSTLN